MSTPCRYCGEWYMNPTHPDSMCPDRAWSIVGDAIEEAMEADPSKSVDEIVEMATAWAQHYAGMRQVVQP